MRFEPHEIPDALAHMLRRAKREDLIRDGFELDDVIVARSRALLPHDHAHAVYHAIFDRSAPHAAVIRPEPVPVEATGPKVEAPVQPIEVHITQAEYPPFPEFPPYPASPPHPSQRVHWVKAVLLGLILLTLLAGKAHCQPASPLIVRGSNGSSVLVTRQSGLINFKCDGTTIICSWSAALNTFTLTGSGGSGGCTATGAAGTVQSSDGAGGCIAAFLGISVKPGGSSGTGNSAMGASALGSNTTGADNTAIGTSALGANTTGSSSVAIGPQALRLNTASRSIGIGISALEVNVSAQHNVAVGGYAAGSNTTGADNTAIGDSALTSNVGGASNTVVGSNAFSLHTSGASNTAIGVNAGSTDLTGTKLTLVGYGTSVAATNLTNATAIGYNAAAPASNTVTIGDTNVTDTYLQGTLHCGGSLCPAGTVTSVSVTTANGISGSVATATTTPAITLTLGAITPSSVAASGLVSGSNISASFVGPAGTGLVSGGALGTPSSGTATNLTGTASGLTVGAATALAANPTNCSAGNYPLGIDASGNVENCTAAATGSVTTVGFTGGLISVANPSTTPALTVAGTSGGLPYFSSASTWASSAAGTINHVIGWGGAGNAPVDLGVLTAGTVTSIATTSPITGGTITSTGTIACATCVTSAASLTNLGAMVGAGSQASQVSGQFVVSNLGTAGTETWTLTNTALATTPAGGHALTNTTAAAVGAQQASPPMVWTGQGWKTTATAASQSVAFRAYVLPVQGATAPSGVLNIDSSIAAAAFSNAIGLASTGASTTVPVLSFGGNTAAGIGYQGSTTLDFFSAGNVTLEISSAVKLASASQFSFCSSTNAAACSTDVVITRFAAATVQHGAADAAAPVAQSIRFQSVVAGTSNTAGVNATFKGSAGTGTGVGGSLIFQVAPAGSTGTAQNALSTAFTLDSTLKGTFAAQIQHAVYAVASLPTCGAGQDGMRAGATDLLTPTFLTAAVGGGAVHGSVYCNGTTWVTD